MVSWHPVCCPQLYNFFILIIGSMWIRKQIHLERPGSTLQDQRRPHFPHIHPQQDLPTTAIQLMQVDTVPPIKPVETALNLMAIPVVQSISNKMTIIRKG